MLTLLSANAQGNHVFSGAELVNFSVADIAVSKGITWSTDRNSIPGYFSVVDMANYTGCTDAANIDGYIKKYGKGGFIFPVGNGKDLRTLEISTPVLSTDAYATAWILGDPTNTTDPTAPFAGTHAVSNVVAPLVMVSRIGQWDWQVGDKNNLGNGTTGTGAGLTITVSIPDMAGFAKASDLRLAGWNGTSWIDLSGTATASGNTENSTIKGTMLAGITALTVASISKFAPFILQSFTATPVNCTAQINWSASNEAGVSKYVVEQSFDNYYFTPIASFNISATAGVNNYSTNAQGSGKSYYRLRIIFNDNTFIYSKVVLSINNCNDPEYMKVYPNPVTSNQFVYVKLGTAYRGKAKMIIFNAIGQRMLDNNVEINNADNVLPADVRPFAAGTYFISIVAENGKKIGSVQKFVKQ